MASSPRLGSSQPPSSQLHSSSIARPQPPYPIQTAPVDLPAQTTSPTDPVSPLDPEELSALPESPPSQLQPYGYATQLGNHLPRPVSPMSRQASTDDRAALQLDTRAKHKSNDSTDTTTDMASVASPSSATASTPAAFAPQRGITVNPLPAYVAEAGASQVIVDYLEEKHQGGDDEDPPSEATFNPAALSLLNTFLDYILYGCLAHARSTSLNALRPAITEVLKQRLAREAIASAEEELRELLAGNDEEDDVNDHQDVIESQSSWDLDLVWKRTRLRVMVYIRLGEMEDEDEERYVNEDDLFHTNDRRFSRSTGLVSWAAAIYLTSVLEYVAERALQISGQAAYKRARRQQPATEDANTTPTPVDVVPVEEHDVEKVALDPSLGRIWRTWRRSLRSGSISKTGARSSSARNGAISPAISNGRLSRARTQSESNAKDAEVAESEMSKEPDPALVPLPMVDEKRDIDEIEVPGLARDPDTVDAEDQNLVEPNPRRQSLALPSSKNFFAESSDLDSEVTASQVMQKPRLTRQRSMSVPIPMRSNLPDEKRTELGEQGEDETGSKEQGADETLTVEKASAIPPPDEKMPGAFPSDDDTAEDRDSSSELAEEDFEQQSKGTPAKGVQPAAARSSDQPDSTQATDGKGTVDPSAESRSQIPPTDPVSREIALPSTNAPKSSETAGTSHKTLATGAVAGSATAAVAAAIAYGASQNHNRAGDRKKGVEELDMDKSLVNIKSLPQTAKESDAPLQKERQEDRVDTRLPQGNTVPTAAVFSNKLPVVPVRPVRAGNPVVKVAEKQEDDKLRPKKPEAKLVPQETMGESETRPLQSRPTEPPAGDVNGKASDPAPVSATGRASTQPTSKIVEKDSPSQIQQPGEPPSVPTLGAAYSASRDSSPRLAKQAKAAPVQTKAERTSPEDSYPVNKLLSKTSAVNEVMNPPLNPPHSRSGSEYSQASMTQAPEPEVVTRPTSHPQPAVDTARAGHTPVEKSPTKADSAFAERLTEQGKDTALVPSKTTERAEPSVVTRTLKEPEQSLQTKPKLNVTPKPDEIPENMPGLALTNDTVQKPVSLQQKERRGPPLPPGQTDLQAQSPVKTTVKILSSGQADFQPQTPAKTTVKILPPQVNSWERPKPASRTVPRIPETEVVNQVSSREAQPSNRTKTDGDTLPSPSKLTSAAIRGPEDFDAFIQNSDTVKYTLTPDNIRDPSQRDRMLLRKSNSPDGSTDFNSRVSSPTYIDTKQNRTSGTKAPATASPSTASPRSPRGVWPLVKKEKRQSITRPEVRNTNTYTKSGFMAREPRVQTESLRDFADFIRSTGPQKGASLPPGTGARSTTNLQGGSQLNGSRFSSQDNLVPGQGLRRQASLEARGPTVNGNGQADLIDFIRTGPTEPGQHRISRTVAPFRSTMDSDDFMNLGDKINTTPPIDSKEAATFSRSVPPRKTASSAPAVQSAKADDSGRTRYRNKDPYAIDFSDDEDDYEMSAKPLQPQQTTLQSSLASTRNPSSSMPPVSTNGSNKAPLGRTLSGAGRPSGFSGVRARAQAENSATSRELMSFLNAGPKASKTPAVVPNQYSNDRTLPMSPTEEQSRAYTPSTTSKASKRSFFRFGR